MRGGPGGGHGGPGGPRGGFHGRPGGPPPPPPFHRGRRPVGCFGPGCLMPIITVLLIIGLCAAIIGCIL